MDFLLTLLGLALLALLALPVWLVMELRALRRRVDVLEFRLAGEPAQAGAASPAARQQPAPAAQLPPPLPAEMLSPAIAVPAPTRAPPLPADDAREYEEERKEVYEGGGPGILTRMQHWLFGGNLPARVGMLVLLAGVAALLRYAGEQGWLRVPVEWRLGAVALTALGALAFGWKQRFVRPGFALVVQGGSIGALLLVVFAAARLYALLGSGAAFAISVGLVAGGAVLALRQESRALAIFSTLAGFFAPIWLADGSGSHVALFAWYALLNAAIFAMAWQRAWRSLNLVGFAFTWGIGILWGVLQYEVEKFWSTQPFLLLFFAMYFLLPWLHALRAPGRGPARVDATLLFGTPLLAFPLQAGLLRGEALPLAFCALGLAALYALFAWRVLGQPRLQRLAQGYAVLAVGFATLAVPLGLSGASTSAVFALEGAALFWLGLAQRRPLARWFGIALQGLAALAWMMAGGGLRTEAFVPVLNPAFMGALMMALAGWTIARLQQKDGTQPGWALAACLWGLLWWLGLGHREISLWRDLHPIAPGVGYWVYEDAARFALSALTLWLAAEAHRLWPARALAAVALGSMLLALVQTMAQHGPNPFALWNGLLFAWLLFAALGLRSLACLRVQAGWLAACTHMFWLLLWAWTLGQALAWFGVLDGAAHKTGQDKGWQFTFLAAPWLALLALALRRWHWLRWPLGTAFDRCQTLLRSSLLGPLGLWWLACLASEGASQPLPWLALLNPLDLAQVLTLVLVADWLRTQPAAARPAHGQLALACPFVLMVLGLLILHLTRPGLAPYAWRHELDALVRLCMLTLATLCLWQYPPRAARGWAMLACAAWLLATVITLRAVHHWGGVAWGLGLPGTPLAQGSLSVVWSVLGVAAWAIGSRRQWWSIWLGGALLMGLVLLKLLLIDRQNLGDLAGIAAFMACGLLCTLTGWLAPAPPRRRDVPNNQAHFP